MNEKRVITWRDADVAICRLAAYMLDDMDTIRTYEPQSNTYDTTVPFEKVAPGYASSRATRGWWTLGTEGISQNPQFSDMGYFLSPVLQIQAYLEQTFWGQMMPVGISQVCWYGFQNLIRLRLRQARQEIHKNLYKQGKKKKRNEQRTRNPLFRQGTKFGRPQE